MKNLSKEPLYGSILQSIMRGRRSEIDYINGEFVRLAKNNNLHASLNGALVDMVHEVEENNRFYMKIRKKIQKKKARKLTKKKALSFRRILGTFKKPLSVA